MNREEQRKENRQGKSLAGQLRFFIRLIMFILMIPAVYNAVKRVKALARLEEYKASEKA